MCARILRCASEVAGDGGEIPWDFLEACGLRTAAALARFTVASDDSELLSNMGILKPTLRTAAHWQRSNMRVAHKPWKECGRRTEAGAREDAVRLRPRAFSGSAESAAPPSFTRPRLTGEQRPEKEAKQELEAERSFCPPTGGAGRVAV